MQKRSKTGEFVTTPLTDEQLEVARELLAEGRSRRYVAEQLGVTHGRVGRAFPELTGPPRPKGRDPRLEKAEQLFEEGYSQLHVSQILGVGVRVLRREFPGRAWTRSQSGTHSQVKQRLERKVQRTWH